MFYDQLKKACTKNNTTVTAALKEIGIGTANGTYWKNGSTPNSDVVIKLSELLNVSTDYLLTGKEPTNQNFIDVSDDKKALYNYIDQLTRDERLILQGELKVTTRGRDQTLNDKAKKT